MRYQRPDGTYFEVPGSGGSEAAGVGLGGAADPLWRSQYADASAAAEPPPPQPPPPPPPALVQPQAPAPQPPWTHLGQVLPAYGAVGPAAAAAQPPPQPSPQLQPPQLHQQHHHMQPMLGIPELPSAFMTPGPPAAAAPAAGSLASLAPPAPRLYHPLDYEAGIENLCFG